MPACSGNRQLHQIGDPGQEDTRKPLTTMSTQKPSNLTVRQDHGLCAWLPLQVVHATVLPDGGMHVLRTCSVHA